MLPTKRLCSAVIGAAALFLACSCPAKTQAATATITALDALKAYSPINGYWDHDDVSWAWSASWSTPGLLSEDIWDITDGQGLPSSYTLPGTYYTGFASPTNYSYSTASQEPNETYRMLVWVRDSSTPYNVYAQDRQSVQPH